MRLRHLYKSALIKKLLILFVFLCTVGVEPTDSNFYTNIGFFVSIDDGPVTMKWYYFVTIIIIIQCYKMRYGLEPTMNWLAER